VHFLAGILVAPFVLLLCLTGLVYACSPQIHEDLYGKQLFVHEVGAAQRPVGEQVAAALGAHPEAALLSVVPPSEPDRTTRVNLVVPGLTEPGAARTVFVDPYTNYINGELTTVEGRMPANVWLRELHSDLHLGAVGRLYSEIAASWLPVLVVGGLVLWIAKQGRRRRSLRELLTPLPRGKGEQTRMRAVHGPLGIWLTAGLLVMSITGLTMSRFAGWGLPAVRAPELAADPVAVPGNARPIGVDRVLQVARAEGLGGELEVTAQTAPDRPFTVAETSPGLPIRKDRIAVDPYTGQVTERVAWEDQPFLAQAREIGQQAHTGTLFGVANQIVLALLVIVTIVLVVIGYRMWWKRSPYRQEAMLPAAPPSALRGLGPSVGVPVVLATVVLGWLLPAFGVSLLAFVAVDLLIAAVRQRQGRARRTIAAGALLVAGALVGAAVLVSAPSFVGRPAAPGPQLPDNRAAAAPPVDVPPADPAPEPGGDRSPVAPGGRAERRSEPAPVASGPAERPADRPEVRPDVGDPGGAAPDGDVGRDRDRADGGDPTGDPGGDSADGRGGEPAGRRDLGAASDGPDADADADARADADAGDGAADRAGRAPSPPPAAAPEEGATGVVGGVVGALADAVEPVTSRLVDTVAGVTEGILGN
jgi:uncharacterized iron-regulated membrane protein